MIEFMIDRRLYFGLTPLASQRSQNSSANEGLRKTTKRQYKHHSMMAHLGNILNVI